jgi:hypothetical protein
LGYSTYSTLEWMIYWYFTIQLTNVTPKGKKPNPADIDIPPLLKVLLPNGWLKNDVAGLFGSRRGGGLWPAGRVGIDGSFLIIKLVINHNLNDI